MFAGQGGRGCIKQAFGSGGVQQHADAVFIVAWLDWL